MGKMKSKRKDLRHKVVDFLSKEGNKLAYIKPMEDHPGVKGGLVEINFYSCFKVDGSQVFYIKNTSKTEPTEILVKKMEFIKGVPGLIKAVCVVENSEVNLYVSCISPIQVSEEDFEEELNEKDPSMLLYIEEKREFPFMLHVLKKGYLQKTILRSISNKCLSILNKQNYEERDYNLSITRYGVDTTSEGTICVVEVTCSPQENREDVESFTLLYKAPIMYAVDLSKSRKQ